MKNIFGTLSLAGGISLLWDEILGLIFSELLDMRDWEQPVPEVYQNLIALLLIALAVVIFSWDRILSWRNKLPHPDARTHTGRKVFVARSIDLSSVSNKEISESVFIDCNLFGDCTVHLDTTIEFGDTFQVRASNDLNNAIFLVEDMTLLEGVLTLRNCILLKCRIATKEVIVTRSIRDRYDPQGGVLYTFPHEHHFRNKNDFERSKALVNEQGEQPQVQQAS